MPPPTEHEHRRKKHIQTSIADYLQPDQHQNGQSSMSSQDLPEDTQSMLISVGMRVRKSVPEGYKTHKTGLTKGSNRTIEQSQATCGLHNVGGFAQQRPYARTDEDVPISSQDTASSQGSQLSTSSDRRKRIFEQELDDEQPDYDDKLLDNMVDLRDRPIARARSRVRHNTDFEDAPFLQPRDHMEVD